MLRSLVRVVIVLGIVAAAQPAGTARQAQDTHAHAALTPASLRWAAGPPSLPAGAQAAVLEGDASKPGAFTLRLKLPDGYKIPPHFHPAVEHITVLQGTFVMGRGEKFDQSAGQELTTGSFGMMPIGTRHFAWTKGETIVQLHGTGPWGITYVNPADDPRKK